MKPKGMILRVNTFFTVESELKFEQMNKEGIRKVLYIQPLFHQQPAWKQ
jgi:hypothetical protein